MELIGRATIHPFFFYTGKLCGYMTWAVTVQSWLGAALLHGLRIEALRILALVLWGGGLLLAAVSLLDLGSSTRLGLPSTPTAFKTQGIYRFSRNPMYLGFNLLTLGAIANNLHPLIVAAGAYSITVYHFIIRGEEKFLGAQFGAEYEAYARKVRRYF